MPQSQNNNEMGFCENCKMNVFPTRPKFNIKIFGFFVVVLFILFSIITVVSLSIFSSIFLIIFFLWGFMVINPYVIVHGLRKKEYCPRCYQSVHEKNIEFKPFGDKIPEIFKSIETSKKRGNVYCPYCGTSILGSFCKSCGRKFEISG